MKAATYSLLIFLGALTSLNALTRTLTNQDGDSLEAELIDLKDKNGEETLTIIRTSDKRKFDLALNTLSFDDQREIRKWWQQQQAEKEVLKPSVELEFNFKQNRKRESLNNYAYSDDDVYFFTPTIEITNDDLYQGYTDNTVRIICFARHTYYKRSLQVTSVAEIEVNFPKKQTTVVSGAKYSFENYEADFSDYEFGWEYAGYIVIVKNSRGEITHIDSSDVKYERALDTVLKMKHEDYYSDDLQRKLSNYSSY
ncbi:hypothetical protein [Cerasicoccus frondis]|uniref:hypothetical protein n=1 Tax=Cerasicoccus frondis TaxID=490090 RepID=UPI002852612C|nr:hypothetical protein [Cerasicoccus frondis]